MSVKKEYFIENTHIIVDDAYIHEDCENMILERIVTLTKPALPQQSESSATSQDE